MPDRLEQPLPDERFADATQPEWTRVAMRVGVIAAVSIGVVVSLPYAIYSTYGSPTTEANMNVRKLFDGAVSYWNEHQTFPASTPLHPAIAPRDSRQMLHSLEWERIPTWQALQFNLTDQHRYHYQFDSRGDGHQAQFTASAFGDLDNDGEFSTFVRFGTVTNGQVNGAGGLFVANELE